MRVSLKHAARGTTSALRLQQQHSARVVAVPRMAATQSPTEPDTTPSPPEAAELKYVGPEPKRFTVSDGQLLEIARAAAPALFRLGSGVFAVGYKSGLAEDSEGYSVMRMGGRKVNETSLVGTFPRPAQPLELYEFEGCPFCKKVREGLSMLDLDAVYYPCPKGGATWRPKAVQLGGKAQFPYLVDPNTGTAMYESDAILQYIFRQYGDGTVPLGLRLGLLTTLSAGLGMAARGRRGVEYVPSKLPEQPLVLWGYEGSPFVKLVKETLCELELPHLQVPVPRGSPRREELLKKRGHFQVPYLEDPNAGVCLFESAAIVAYLRSTYAA